MINEVIINGKIYKLESVWRISKDDHSKDMRGKLFPFPHEEASPWAGLKQFVDRLEFIQAYLDQNKKYENLKKCEDCLLCGKKCVTSKRYILGNTIWQDGLIHYII